MPYDYTPTPAYTVPVQLASDGDPASSATIMGPIEAALDNVAAIWELGPKTIRHVDDLVALKALTGMAHNEVALVASAGLEGFPGESMGLWRYILGDSVDIESAWAVDANDGSGAWVWIDYSRVGTAGGLTVLQSARRLDVAPGSAYTTSADTVRVRGAGYLEVVTSGEIRVQNEGHLLINKTGTGIADGGTMTVSVGGTPFDPARGLHMASGGGAHVDSGGLLAVHAGGALRVEGSATLVSGGTATLEAGSSTSLEGSMLVAEGGYIELADRIRHSVTVWTNAELAGSPIVVWPETADEHIFGDTPAAPTTITLEPPAAVGQRVRFSRTSRTSSATHLTVSASGQSYILSGGGGDLMWLELVSAYSGATLVWYPSTYAVH